jgi:hypothetical protein
MPWLGCDVVEGKVKEMGANIEVVREHSKDRAGPEVDDAACDRGGS